MPASTTYDVRLRYMMQDRASRGLKNITREAEKASKASGMLRSGLGKMAAIGIGAFGIGKATKALIGFNSDMEQAKTTMAGMIQLNLGGEWADNMKTANRLVANFQERAKTSVGTTKDFVDMAQMIARPVTAAGLGMKELEDITSGATVAARAFGMAAEVAALDIEQVLAGTMAKKDRFAQAILGPILKMNNMTVEMFNKLDAQSRAMLLKQALTSKTIQDMSQAQAGTFAGVYSTFQDNLQRFLGAVGMPLFKALTAEIQKWNTWLEKNQQTVNEWAKKFGEALVSGFRFIGKTISFFIQHKDALLFIAKAWAAMKIGGRLGGLVAAAGQAVGGGISKAGGMMMYGSGARATKAGLQTAKFGAGLATAATTVGRFVPAVGLGIVAMKGLYDWWKSADRKKKEAERKKIAEDVAKVESMTLGQLARAEGRTKQRWVGAELSQLETMLTGKAEVSGKGSIGLGKYGTWKEATESNWEDVAIMTAKYEELREKVPQVSAAFKELSLNITKLSGPGARAWQSFIETGKISYKELETLSGEIAAQAGIGKWKADAFTMTLDRMTKEMEHGADRGEVFRQMIEGTYSPWAMQKMRANLAGPAPAESTSSFEKELQAQLKTAGKNGKSRVNVTINKIEVQTDDPDRFVFGMSEAFSDAAKNPSSVIDAFREG